MRVCAEAMFAFNAAIDAMLLVCSGRLCGARLAAGRVCAAAALGGVYAVLALVPALGFLQHGLMRICAMALMLLLAFGWGRKLPRLAVMFLASGCAFAGLVFAMLQLTGTGLLRMKGGGFYPVSGGALAMLLAACCALVRLLFSACAQHGAGEYRELTLQLGKTRTQVRALVDTGNTVVVIEHNLDLIKRADHIIDIGPEGGDAGGRIVAQGTPEQVAAVKASYTGQYLKKLLRK